VREPRQIRCGIVVGRPDGSIAHLVAQFDMGHAPFDLAQLGEPRKIRARGIDDKGAFVRDLIYSYGRVDVGEARR
jgi:hypothetical protein